MYPESKAIKTWKNEKIEDVLFSIVVSRGGFHCGYVRFLNGRPLSELGYYGIVSYVPVHGGITYAECDPAGFVYGFDCGHWKDNTRPWLSDIEWLSRECERMAMAIIEAKRFEDAFLKAQNDDDIDEDVIIDDYHRRLLEMGVYNND